MRTLVEFHSAVAQLDSKAETLRDYGATDQEFAELDDQFQNLVSATSQNLKRKMSEAGYTRLQAHVLALKPKIGIYRKM